jgi:hypothetical protein
MSSSDSIAKLLPAILLTYGLGAMAAHADVAVQEQTTYDFSLIKAHGNSTELTSSDKQRRDSELHCEGMMSLLCRNAQSGEIIRLDKDLTWVLDPKNKEYRESRFPTPAERAAAEAQVQATLEKIKQCPAVRQPASNAPDTSKCQMSPPKIDAQVTDKHATFAGHDTRLSQLSLTQSCHNPETGDTCDFLITLDSWLTQDEIPGAADRKAFREAHMKKLGLNDPNSGMQQQLRQFLAPYRDSLKELSSKADNFKGYPLKTAFRISFGGAQCAAAKNAPPAEAGSATPADAGATAGQAAGAAAGKGVAGGLLGSAAGAFGAKLASGLFSKKPAAPPAEAPAAADTPPNMMQLAQVSVETTSITAAPIPLEQFDIPAGWKLVTPKAAKGEAKEFSCPKTGE